jgi:ketosteroid isomerase-like protein
MNRKVSVFILLILLASSFKYRTKAVEAKLAPIAVKGNSAESPTMILRKKAEKEFELVVKQMQEANKEFYQGNPAAIKSLWSHEDDVTIVGGFGGAEVKGWKSVEPRLDQASRRMPDGSKYKFENVASNLGTDMAYLLQSEHYSFGDGKETDSRVTILFRKEASGWKIIHRHADNLVKK